MNLKMNKTKKAIFLVLICTIFTSLAQIFYKLGADRLSLDIIAIITNWQIITGLALYGIGAILLIKALKLGDLSLLYPILATSYIWVGILSIFLFNESLSGLKWTGIILITLGVTYMGKGSSKEIEG